MREDPRIRDDPVLRFERGREIRFYYRGRAIVAYDGETIAAALYASGIRTFSRGIKYHRPRGLLCMGGWCPNCMVRVDGVPNVRGCTTPARERMQVEPQNTYPSPDLDLLSVLDRLADLFPVGFQYRRFIHPGSMRSLYQRLVRKMAGYGTLPAARAETAGTIERTTEVVVVGGGVAGLAAAKAAALMGARVTLVDEGLKPGGRLAYHADRVPGWGEGIASQEVAKLYEDVQGLGVEVVAQATAVGLYPGNLLGVIRKEGLLRLKAKRVVLATGAYDLYPPFEGNDLPGVLLAAGTLRLMNGEGIRPGRKAVVLGTGDLALNLAFQLERAGVEVQGLLEEGPEVSGNEAMAERLVKKGISIFTSARLKAAYGRGRVEGVSLMREGGEELLEADLLCLALGLKPAYELPFQAGCRAEYVPGVGYVPTHDAGMRSSLEGVYVAGGVIGAFDPPGAASQGVIAGISAALGLGYRNPGLEEDMERMMTSPPGGVAPGGTGAIEGGFLCICEDVRYAEVKRAIREGYADIESLKRYTGVGTGICQGKLCLRSLVELLAREGGKDPSSVRLTTQRPPVRPVDLGKLAGGKGAR